MKLWSAPLALFFVLILNCSVLTAAPVSIIKPANAQEIMHLVKQAVEYNGWVNEPEYKKELGRLYDGLLLTELIDSVEQFRSTGTDWHTLTFAPKCHIVYNDGETALVLAYLMETSPEGTEMGQGCGAFSLHNTPYGWRITQMEIIWPPPN
ncbi:MAG TPA: hypothetical protein DEF34_08580 [Desulfotomaculum sp.]|nr:MAG: hypothetical protein VR67_16630 [Peptococcaceae bacterium BRH_c8a]KJS76601.1 MAG: hypothetical protein JL56_04825 [Desulfotomaculum sp. BICA1-6]HBX23665.1 hypothetical protein [Desulfotomaculum sp.]